MFIAMADDEESGIAAAAPTRADEGKARAVKSTRAKAELQEVNLTGKLTKVETKIKNGKVRTSYFLTDPDGKKSRVQKPTAKKSSKNPSINLNEFVGSDVTLVGMAVVRERKSGKGVVKSTTIEKILTIEKIKA